MPLYAIDAAAHERYAVTRQPYRAPAVAFGEKGAYAISARRRGS